MGLLPGTDPWHRRKNEQAAATLRDAVRLDNQYPARIKLAEVLLNLHRLDESQETCESIAKEYPRFAPVYYWLGRVASAKGQVASSTEHYRTACRLWPSFGTAHYALALACQKANTTAEAQEHMAAFREYKADGDPQPEDTILEAVRSLDNTALAHLMKGVELENAGQLEQDIAQQRGRGDGSAARLSPYEPDCAVRPGWPGRRGGEGVSGDRPNQSQPAAEPL